MTQTKPKKRPPLLTKSKGQWADQFKPDQIKGSTLNYNAALQMRYEKEIQGLVSQMTAQVERSIERFFKGELAEEYFASDASISTQAKFLTNKLTNTFESLFKKRSLAMAQRMVKGASKISKSALHSSLKELSGGLSINTGVVPSELEEVRSEEHTSELQSRENLVCRLLLEKKKR